VKSILFAASLGVVTAAQAGAQPLPSDFFESRIRPVLATRCYACHASTLAAPKGGLALDTKAGVLKGGNARRRRCARQSLREPLLQALRYSDPHLQMPPSGKLADSIISDFEAVDRRRRARSSC
jgi:hypothetical protein